MQARTTKLIDGRTIVNPAVSYQLACASIDADKAANEQQPPLFEAIGFVNVDKL